MGDVSRYSPRQGRRACTGQTRDTCGACWWGVPGDEEGLSDKEQDSERHRCLPLAKGLMQALEQVRQLEWSIVVRGSVRLVDPGLWSLEVGEIVEEGHETAVGSGALGEAVEDGVEREKDHETEDVATVLRAVGGRW